MACSLQKLFSVEAEFEDEDFLLAVKDVEKQVLGPTPTNLRCLRPLSSGLTASSKPPIPTQDLGTLGPSETTFPVLQVPNYSRLKFGENNSPSNVRSNQTTSPCNSKVQKDLASLSTECKSNCTSGTRFKFVNRRPAALPTGGAPHGEDLDNELFLNACMDLDKPDSLSHQEPSRFDFKSQGQMEDNSVSERVATAKRPRTASSMMPMNPVGSDTLHLDKTRKETPVGVVGQPVKASPKSALRPTTMGPCLSQSNLNTSLAAHPNFSYQTPKQPFQAPLVRSYSPSCSMNTPLRPATPQTHSQNSFMPRMASSGAQLLTAYGPTVTPPATPNAPCSTGSAGNLQTPVVTNHLVRLVTAVNKTPQLTGCLPSRSKTRRFPGPAGILPHHPDGKNLEEILISAPQTPTHGAVAKLQTEEMPASQQPIDEFGRGPWVTMKTELGLDERDPSCFLRTYSVVMVLRKAALKQLPKNKVPSMAVIIKSLMRTNVDAGAVFKDPTGEMQGTVHRLLLEEKENEFKAGAVLLLKQVGVFSPSHRNHYLNVTPNNLVKIYPPGLSSGKPPQLCLDIRERMKMVPPQALLKVFSLIYTKGLSLPSLPGSCGVGKSMLSVPSPKTQKADSDDLDQLLGELPDDFFCLSDAQSRL
ncbi:homologous recombination OB-fold protein [Tiliqua scincoides]|uniref:homologous recombination OB-fold protein n=1 Tax=Tiliqua scincoides TaxID=71010 RepID=UPI003462C2B2